MSTSPEGFEKRPLALYRPERLSLVSLRFIQEQNGPFENTLKTKLREFFMRDHSVQRAYLVRVENDKMESVALCLKTQFGEDHGMAEKVGRIFATIFKQDQSLDIFFLTDKREEELQAVCTPFFNSIQTI